MMVELALTSLSFGFLLGGLFAGHYTDRGWIISSELGTAHHAKGRFFRVYEEGAHGQRRRERMLLETSRREDDAYARGY